ncbi:MAG: RnfABCDGE type electron transport complex subunit G [Oscillospiraceae bacterium]|nr:RnfABCDGE type electron transport complex subunit G [Oscillospiraceae bacterium]
MKQNESMAMYILRLAGTLLLICAVTAGLLAGVNAVTEPIIAELNAAKTQEAIAKVLPGGFDTEITEFTDATGLVSKIYKGENGYAVEVGPGGFDNTITMMVGIDNEGKVLGISIVSHTETAGLGAVAAAGTPAGISFRDQFVGMSAANNILVEKDKGEVEAITGATITSRAICVGVNAALDVVAGLG